MNYEIDYCYDFRVLPGSPNDIFFNLEVDGPRGKDIVQLPKVDFQRSPHYHMPATLNCRVKGFDNNGLPMLGHVPAQYVYELYKSTYEKGESFESRVVTIPSNPAESPYILADNYGIRFNYYEPEGMLTKGQRVLCKFSRLLPKYFSIERVDEGAKLPYYTPDTIFDAIGTRSIIREFVKGFFENKEELTTVVADIDAKSPMWLIGAARRVLKYMPEWLVNTKVRTCNDACRTLIITMRDGLLYLLEGSGFLNAVATEHRSALREQITGIVEALEPYLDTLDLIAAGRQDAFVQSLLDKLQKSGYLYHPAHQFAMLMTVFRLHPDKVGDYLSRIFESIFGRELENWQREPFRSAFVEQFDIYVKNARRDIDELPLAETREQKTRLENIITAIALQLILAKPDEDMQRSESLFYRYISLLRPLNTEALLTKSFLTLMGAKMGARPVFQALREPMMMMTQATVLPAGDPMSRLHATHRYSNGLVDLSISAEGIRLRQSRRNDVTERVIPEGLMPWLRPQILLNGIRGLSGSRMRKLDDHRQWWLDIETSLFETQAPKAATQPEALKRADRGDDVYIVIDDVVDFSDPNPVFNVHIADSEYAGGTGTLQRDQIVGYNLKAPSPKAWRTPTGSQRGFLARVLDVNPDGTYIFSLRDEVINYINDSFNYEDTYIGLIASTNDGMRDFSALSRLGAGLFLERDGKEHAIGDIVKFRISQKNKYGQLKGYIVETSNNPADKFDKSEAFVNLMQAISEVDDSDDSTDTPQPQCAPIEETDPIRDIDEILTTEDIRELISIIRFRAIAEGDLIKAYDYLRLARLMALTISDDAMAEKLGTHASLLVLHQYYAANSRIEPEELEALKTESEADPLLRMIYHRLEMVSWLGRGEYQRRLFETAEKPSNELEGSIARMVLSYNMLKSSDNESDTIASDIKSQIMKKLNVNNETRRGKYYGSESKYLEFKTSIVYPATLPGQELREDPEAQQYHILSRIAGMLNANGGRLYIGVNNDGYEVGLHDDFRYFERHNAKVGNHTFRIKNLDNLCVFLENLIDASFDKSVARKITVSADDEATKNVVLIEIAESLDPVFLDGRLYVRQSGQSTREYHGGAIDEFVRERAELRAERAHILALEAHETAVKPTAVPSQQPVASTVASEPAAMATTNDTAATTIPVIQTSRWRPNVYHDYDPNFIEPLGYLYFLDDNKLMFSTENRYLEPGADCRQVLVVTHDNAADYLILGFENERALRIPLTEIFEKGDRKQVEYNSEYELLFAAVAAKDDALICVAADGSGNMWKRANKIAAMDAAHIMSTPKRLHDTPIHHTITYEIADAAALDRFEDSMADKISSAKRFGTTMRVNEKNSTASQRIENLAAECHYSL